LKRLINYLNSSVNNVDWTMENKEIIVEKAKIHG